LDAAPDVSPPCALPRGSRSPHPCSTAVDKETFSSPVFKRRFPLPRLTDCYCNQDLHHGSLHVASLCRHRRSIRTPLYMPPIGFHGDRSVLFARFRSPRRPGAARYGFHQDSRQTPFHQKNAGRTAPASASSVFGANNFGRWVVTRSSAGSNLHGHRPAIPSS